MRTPVRTPGGEPLRCPVCGKVTVVEVAANHRDATCPACGTLLWSSMHREILRRLLMEQRSKPRQEPAADPEETTRPTTGQVEQAIDRLPERLREVIVRRDFDGNSWAQIAEAMHMTASSARELHSRALLELAKDLRRIHRAGDETQQSP